MDNNWIKSRLVLLMIMLMPMIAFAEDSDYGCQGTIEITVGETKYIELPSKIFNVLIYDDYPSGKWYLNNNNNAMIVTNKALYCEVKGLRKGDNIKLTFSGSCQLPGYYFWSYTGYYLINVVDSSSPEPSPDEPKDEPTDDWCKSGNYSISWFSKTKTEFTISTNKELAGMTYLVNNGYTEFSGCTIKLSADIDLSDKKWIQCKTFKGTFDGQGHSITGIYMSTDMDEQKYFGFWQEMEKARITNLTMEGVASFRYIPQTNVWTYAGGMAGTTKDCIIENCNVLVDVSFSRGKCTAWNFANAAEGCYIGGIVGSAEYGQISYSRYSGSLKGNFPQAEGPQSVFIAGIAAKAFYGKIEYCEVLSPCMQITDYGETYRCISGVVHNCGSARFCRSIIDNITIRNVNSSSGNGHSVSYKVAGIVDDGSLKNCYAVINTINMYSNYPLTAFSFGGISIGNNPIASFSNNNICVDSTIEIKKVDESGNSPRTCYDGSTSFSSEQMQTPAFLEELNMYSILEADGPVWTQPAEGGYPYIAALHEPTAVKTINSVKAKPAPIFSLSGQRLAAPKKGINIIGGKKVVVK